MNDVTKMCQVLGLDPFSAGLQLVDASRLVGAPSTAPATDGRDPFAGVYRQFDPARPVLVGTIDRPADLGEARRALAAEYPPGHQVSIVHFGGESAAATVSTVPIESIDAEPWSGGQVCLYLPPVDRLADVAAFDTLRYVVAKLRAPNGCPWDREQTYHTIKKHLIEETYEAVAALDEDDYPRFAEELGDVLLQVVMYGQLGREAGDFALEDILRAVNEKLVRRHPHVFGDVQVENSADVLRNWEKIKRAEKGAAPSTVRGVPEAAPALMRADAVQSRATRYGWTPPAETPRPGAATAAGLDRVERLCAVGDLLFDVVTLARRFHIDPEEALRLATNRFRDSFDRVLRDCEAAGEAFDSLPPEERRRLVLEARRGLPSSAPREEPG